MEAKPDVEPPLVAGGKPAEAGEPGERALDHPAVPARPLRVLDTAAGSAGRNAPAPCGPAAVVVVIPFVGVQLARSLPRSTGALADGRHSVEQRLEEAAVVDVLPEHFLRLDSEDRRRRFGGHASDERVRAYGARLERHPGDAVDPAATCAAM